MARIFSLRTEKHTPCTHTSICLQCGHARHTITPRRIGKRQACLLHFPSTKKVLVFVPPRVLKVLWLLSCISQEPRDQILGLGKVNTWTVRGDCKSRSVKSLAKTPRGEQPRTLGWAAAAAAAPATITMINCSPPPPPPPPPPPLAPPPPPPPPCQRSDIRTRELSKHGSGGGWRP